MDTQTQKIFRTKNGFCHILPDKIAFSKDGKPESIDLSEPRQHASIKFMVTYGLIILLVTSFVIYKYLSKEINLAASIVTISFIAIFLYYIFKVLNYQTRTYFDRDRIVKIKYVASLGPFTHGQFVVTIKSETGKLLTATIILRDHHVFGKEETEEALKIMVDEGLIPDLKTAG